MSQSISPPSEAGITSDNRRPKTRLIDEITVEFEHMKLQVGDSHVVPQIEPGTNGEKIRISTNVHGIKMQKMPVYRYDVTISGTVIRQAPGRPREVKKLEFTKRSSNDTLITERKAMCERAFSLVFDNNEAFFGKDYFSYYYDMQAILYSLKQLDLGEEKEVCLSLERDRGDYNGYDKFGKFAKIEVLLKNVRDAFQLTLGDLSAFLTNDTSGQNHSLRQFIEIATSQVPLFMPHSYAFLDGSFYLLASAAEREAEKISELKFMGPGVHKSARYVEGPCGRNNQHVALVVESKKTPLYKTNESLIELALKLVGYGVGSRGEFDKYAVERLNYQFRNLTATVFYGASNRTREILISQISSQTAADVTFQNREGRRTNVVEHYLNTYDIALRYPNAPLVGTMEKRKLNYYPMELVHLGRAQRANLKQLTAREANEMIKVCSVPPKQLKAEILSCFSMLGIAMKEDKPNLLSSPYLEKCGIDILAKPLIIDGRHLPAPIINMRKRELPADNNTGKFNMSAEFLEPATINCWTLYAIPGEVRGVGNQRFQMSDFGNFAKMFVENCRAFGMTINMPAHYAFIHSTPEDVEKTIAIAKQEKCEFVMFITADGITSLHNVIKRCEQKYQIITQDLKMKNVWETINRNKRETMRNIICKTNEKMGGVNYSLTCTDKSIQDMICDGTLFVGLGVSHPGAVSNLDRMRQDKKRDDGKQVVPSVIGFAANMKKDPYDFVGDFLFDQPRREEKFSTISSVIDTCLRRFIEHRSMKPKRLIVFRNGTSDGQYQMSLLYEVPLIRYALQNQGCDDCKLTVMVFQRMHSVRFFREPIPENYPRGETANIKPGTVADVQVTHPLHREFYLNSHLAIKGTARTPRYTVLVDDSEFSMDTVEGFTNALAYCHKIVNSPTSLPSPAYIAGLYAKRGRAIYSVVYPQQQRGFSGGGNRGGRFARGGAGSQSGDYGGSGDSQQDLEEEVDFEQATNQLCYDNTSLRDQRVNA